MRGGDFREGRWGPYIGIQEDTLPLNNLPVILSTWIFILILHDFHPNPKLLTFYPTLDQPPNFWRLTPNVKRIGSRTPFLVQDSPTLRTGTKNPTEASVDYKPSWDKFPKLGGSQI